VVTGFEPLDLLQGIYLAAAKLASGSFGVENQYARVVRASGNPSAQALMREVFEVVPRKWRGIGELPASGLGLRAAFARFDAERRFSVQAVSAEEPAECRSGLVLRGLLRPDQCPAFGTRCTPDRPLGATMVSSEGACSAYFRYRSLRP
jgi:hydrogenase expression/formation protein HypD